MLLVFLPLVFYMFFYVFFSRSLQKEQMKKMSCVGLGGGGSEGGFMSSPELWCGARDVRFQCVETIASWGGMGG